MGNLEDRGGGHCVEGGPSLGLNDRVEVCRVSRQVQGGDLPLAVERLLEAAYQAFDNETGMLGHVVKPNEVDIGRHLRSVRREIEDFLLLAFAQA